jgi:hypothetical protein
MNVDFEITSLGMFQGESRPYFDPLRCFSKKDRAAFHALSASAPLKP